jgi:hypothetical protein
MAIRSASGTLGGVSMKHLSLVTVSAPMRLSLVYVHKLIVAQLTFQNSALILVRSPFTANDYPSIFKERSQNVDRADGETGRVSG